MTPAEHAAAIRAVLEQVTAFEVGDPLRFNQAVAAIGYLDELAERAERAETALRNIINTLGPEHFGGELEGLVEEGNEALRIARAALGETAP